MSSAEEGRGTLRKALASRVQAQEPEMSEWGNPARVIPGHRRLEGVRREPGEVKHLSTPRKREDSASSGERKWRSPNRRPRTAGLKDPGREAEAKPNGLGRPTREGESPVGAAEVERGYPEYHGAR